MEEGFNFTLVGFGCTLHPESGTVAGTVKEKIGIRALLLRRIQELWNYGFMRTNEKKSPIEGSDDEGIII